MDLYGTVWHTLKEDGSKYRLKFMLDKKELLLTLDDFRTIFHLPQENDNNHDRFMPPPSFSNMVLFYKNELGFTMELKTSSSFKTTVFCSHGKQLLWEEIHYSLYHSTYLIPYPRFTKIIIGHYITNFIEISRRARDKYHNLKNDDIMKNIFNSGRYKDKVGMKIPDWMISEAMKHTEHYWMYAEVFGINVPLTQSQPTESTQGTYRTPSAPRSTHLTPPTTVPTVDKADEMILQDTLHVSLAEHKSREEQEARENVELVNEHLAFVEIEKVVEGQENVIDDSSISKNDEHNSPGTRLEPRSDKESPKVEFTDVVIPVNVNEEEEEITHEVARFMPRKSFATLASHLQEVMVDSLPIMVEKHVKEQVQKQVPEQDDPHDDAHPEGKNSAKRQKTSEYEAYVSRESSSGQDNKKEKGPSTLGNQVQVDDYDFWIESYASDDDEIPTKKEILVSPHPRKTTTLVQSCQRDPEAPVLSLINQDLLYLKKGSSGPEKIVLSLHKFSAVIFNDSDIEERTFRCVNKYKEPGKPKEVIYSNSKIIQVIKTYWELGHEHKFIIEIVARRANECIVSIIEPDFMNLNKNDIKDMYLLIMNVKVPDYVETWLLWSLLVFIRSLVIWERVHDFQLGIKSYQQNVNLTALTISFLGIEEHEMFSIIYEPVYGIIYKNSKKEERAMRHTEIHKFCDATLNRVLEGLKRYNNDVKYGYIQKDLTKDEAEYLKLFEEEIEVRLKYRRQMRRWEMYVNGRPLGPRREGPE
nr:hypothetical protein [Tanacetum cinerariifolium]